MRIYLVFLFVIAAVAVARADQKISEVQQSLKDQGFYYGDVNGESNKETTDAVRRYQIRNGLTVSGELDDQTIQSIRKSETDEQATTTTAPQPAATASTAPPETKETTEDHSPSVQQEPSQPLNAVPPAPPGPTRSEEVYDGQPVPEKNDVFARTPYETVPPELQHKVIMDAQGILAQKGLYKYPPDGVFSPNVEFSLRAYQARVGLRPSGRLDLETLAAMELLPASHRRPIPRPRVVPSSQPPVRGEWIRP